MQGPGFDLDDPLEALEPGTTLGAFAIERVLARGGAGTVYAARNTASGLPVAVKVMARLFDTAARGAFSHEIALVAGMDHPNIVGLYDYGSTATAAWLAMQRADHTLEEARDDLRWPAIRSLTLQLLHGLAHAHAHGVIHRDLKPANVLCFERGGHTTYKLADFGVARLVASDTESQPRGTPLYMAPEQIQGEWRDQGPPTDLYALGCLVWELVTGDTPFSGTVGSVLTKHIFKELPPFAPRLEVPEGLEAWLRRLLEKRPADRFATAPEARSAFPPARPLPPLPDRFPRELATRSMPAGAGLDLLELRTIPVSAREAERQALWDALRACVEDRAQRLVILEGTPGMGRTRLMRWLAVEAAQSGWATCIDPGPAPDGLHTFAETVLRCRGLDGQARYRRVLGRLGADADPVAVSRIGALATPEPLLVAEDREATWLGLLDTVAGDRAAVVLVDDAHAHLEAVLGWTRRLLRYRGGSGVLVVATVRRGRLGARGREFLDQLGDMGAIRIVLEPMPIRDIAAMLVETVLLEANVARAVAERSGGCPGSAIQIVTEWIGAGVLRVGPGGVVLDPDASVETTQVSTWGDRLASLFDGEIDPALVMGALLGRRVDSTTWVQACRAAGLDPCWAALEKGSRMGLIHLQADGWAFARDAVRATTLDAVGAEVRAQLARVAAAGIGAEAPPALQAALWLEAGDIDRAEVIVSRAVRDLDVLHPYDDATLLPLWRRVIEARELPADHPARGELLAAETMVATSEGSSATALDDAIDTARRRGFTQGLGVLYVLRARRRIIQRDLGGAEADLALALTCEPNDRTRHAILTNQALVAHARGDHHRRLALLDALLDDAAPDSPQQVAALRHRGRALIDHGRYEEGLTLLESIQEQVRSRGGIGDYHNLLVSMAIAHDRTGRPRQAERYFREALAAMEALRSPYRESEAWNDLAENLRRQGRLDEAEVAYQRSLDLAERAGARPHPVLYANIGLVYLAREEWAEAANRIQEALNACLAAQATGWVGVCAALLLPAVVDDEPRFRDAVTRTLDALDETGFTDPECVTTARLAARRARGAGLESLVVLAESVAEAHAAALAE